MERRRWCCLVFVKDPGIVLLAERKLSEWALFAKKVICRILLGIVKLLKKTSSPAFVEFRTYVNLE